MGKRERAGEGETRLCGRGANYCLPFPAQSLLFPVVGDEEQSERAQSNRLRRDLLVSQGGRSEFLSPVSSSCLPFPAQSVMFSLVFLKKSEKRKATTFGEIRSPAGGYRLARVRWLRLQVVASLKQLVYWRN